VSRPNPNQIRRNAKRARLIRDWRALAARTHERIADTRKDAPEGDDLPSGKLNRFSMDQEDA
jgi:hypothetical protein